MQGRPQATPLPQANAYALIGNRTFRATGIAAYLKNGCENAPKNDPHEQLRYRSDMIIKFSEIEVSPFARSVTPLKLRIIPENQFFGTMIGGLIVESAFTTPHSA